jgi:PKD repeat protein
MPPRSTIIRRVSNRSRGQSFAEFALLLPALLLIVMVGIDFGRVYLGWVNLQNMTRIAANFAANNPEAWNAPGDLALQARYNELIQNDARAINCTTPDPAPGPIFASGTDLGDPVEVQIDCSFSVLTPIISDVLGGSILVSANSVFPVKAGIVGSVPGGGPPVPAPVASFTASPSSGMEDLEVLLTDTSTNVPTSWTWTFGDGTAAYFGKNPPPHEFADPGTYTVTLKVTNSGGSDLASVDIEVLPQPTTGPIPEFSATPRAGFTPFGPVAFTDLSTNGPTSWSWQFGDGGTSSGQNPSHTYNANGLYDVTLTVSDGTTSNSQTKVAYIVVTDRPCIVPNFAGTKKNRAQATWTAAGFTTTVGFAPGQGNYTILVQSIPGGLPNPPGGCGATITVGP